MVPTPADMIQAFTTKALEVQQDLANKIYTKEELAMVLAARDEFRKTHKK